MKRPKLSLAELSLDEAVHAQDMTINRSSAIAQEQSKTRVEGHFFEVQAVATVTHEVIAKDAAEALRKVLRMLDPDVDWDIERVTQSPEHPGAVCSDCGRTVSDSEHSYGESACCTSDVVAEEDYRKAGK